MVLSAETQEEKRELMDHLNSAIVEARKVPNKPPPIVKGDSSSQSRLANMPEVIPSFKQTTGLFNTGYGQESFSSSDIVETTKLLDELDVATAQCDYENAVTYFVSGM